MASLSPPLSLHHLLTDSKPPQAPKTTINPTKLASALSYLHASRTAHTLKDLEKTLPAHTAIASMQVKDYLSALVDEHGVHVEKIGAGNWYWSFPSEACKLAEAELERAKAATAKLRKQVDEARGRVEAARKGVEGEEEGEREVLVAKRDELVVECAALEKEAERLGQGSVEAHEVKVKELAELKAKAEQLTDQILAMEGWLAARCEGEREQLLMLKREVYGAEFDEEEEGLRELY